MGSTQKMGAGTNVQDRLIALHDLDCPWRPGDLEQRKGRIVRQGNSNPTVHIYRYVTESTFDAYLWQTVETKQRFISQIMTSKSPVRSCDDIDETALSYAEIKALSAGDPRIKEKMDLDVEVAQLKILKADYESQRFRLQDDLSLHLPEKMANTEAKIASIEKDIGIRDAHSARKGEFAGMTVSGKAYGDKEEAAKALIVATKSVKDFGEQAIGSYRGFEMTVATNGFTTTLTLKGAGSHTIELGQSSQGNMIRIDNALERLPKQLEEAKERLASLHQQVEASKEELNKPFARETELAEKNARLIELNTLLDMDEPGECVGDDGDDISSQLHMAPERSFDGEMGAAGFQRNPFTVSEHAGCEPIEPNYTPASNESLSQAANRVLGTMSQGYGSGQRSEVVVER